MAERIIPKRIPKAADIVVSEDGRHYSGARFHVEMQEGPVSLRDVPTGVYPEELLAVVIDRLKATGQEAAAAQLATILDQLAPELPKDET